MLDRRRQAYLGAMGITTWVLRNRGEPGVATAAISPRLRLGPGNGGALMVCASDSEAAGRLAGDISRALGGVPVWAWPDAAEEALLTLEQAVAERLFTSVAIFGAELAAALFPRGVPDSVQTAGVMQLPSMPELQRDGEARRCLWQELWRAGITAAA